MTLATHVMARSVEFYTSFGFEPRYGGPEAGFSTFAVGNGYLNLIAQAAERAPCRGGGSNYGLIKTSHRGVLVGSHVRQHPVEAEPAVWRLQPKARPSRPQTVGRPVIRKVDFSGNVSSLVPTIGSGTLIAVNRSRCW